MAVTLLLCSPGIPLLCFLVLLPLNIPWSQISVTWLGVVHFLACLSPQLGSVLYHLFMNHEGGEPVYHTLLKLDVCGICMINTLGKSQRGAGSVIRANRERRCFAEHRINIDAAVKQSNVLTTFRCWQEEQTHPQSFY